MNSPQPKTKLSTLISRLRLAGLRALPVRRRMSQDIFDNAKLFELVQHS
jgi:hypothetical protein